jgi:outer membrane biosynthesis protein TonB
MERSSSVLKGLEPEWDKEAVQTVTQWEFTPATKAGHPVAMHMVVEVNFRLDRP